MMKTKFRPASRFHEEVMPKVTGEKFGLLAVHRSLDAALLLPDWTISHRPTGCLLGVWSHRHDLLRKVAADLARSDVWARPMQGWRFADESDASLAMRLIRYTCMDHGEEHFDLSEKLQ